MRDEVISPVRVPTPLDVPGYALQVTLDDFITAIVTGNEPHIETSEARQALVTVEAAYEAMRSGTRVEIAGD